MKKRLFILLPVFLFTAFAAAAQTDAFKDTSIVFTKAEHMPAYKGGDQAWLKFLQRNLKYPQEAIDKEQQGTVMVGFIVDTTGHLSNIDAITKPAGPLIEEALRIIRLSDGDWEPAMVKSGQKVRCFFMKPVKFRLDISDDLNAATSESSADSITKNSKPGDWDVVFTKAEYAPEFKGGEKVWEKFLRKNLQYPQEAIDQGLQGMVTISFMVDKNGRLSNFNTVSSPGESLSLEAIRVLQLSDGEWKPATQNGRIVKCYCKKTITFRTFGKK